MYVFAHVIKFLIFCQNLIQRIKLGTNYCSEICQQNLWRYSLLFFTKSRKFHGLFRGIYTCSTYVYTYIIYAWNFATIMKLVWIEVHSFLSDQTNASIVNIHDIYNVHIKGNTHCALSASNKYKGKMDHWKVFEHLSSQTFPAEIKYCSNRISTLPVKYEGKCTVLSLYTSLTCQEYLDIYPRWGSLCVLLLLN